jgi:hypothetical protein
MDRIETQSAITTCILNTETGFATFKSAHVVLVRYQYGAQWEQYRVIQSGSSKGLEMFVRYVDSDVQSRAECALVYECARARTPSLPSRMDALIEALMYARAA